MSATSSKDETTQVNPYSAPRSQANLGFGKLLTLTLICLVVAGFVTANSLAYWGFLTPDEPDEIVTDQDPEEISRQIRAYEEAAKKMPGFPRTPGKKE